MKRVYSICVAETRKDGQVVQLIGNDLQRLGICGVESYGFTAFKKPLIPDLTYDEGVILCEVRMETKPFDGYTHEAWVYGVPRQARVSSLEPYYSRKRCRDGHRKFFACGRWWINSWCDFELFPERDGGIIKVYFRADRTDKTAETDFNGKRQKEEE